MIQWLWIDIGFDWLFFFFLCALYRSEPANRAKKRTPRTWAAVCGLAAVSTQQSTAYVKSKSRVYIHSLVMQFYVYFKGIRHKKNMLHCHLHLQHLSLKYLCIPQSSDRVSKPFGVRLQQSTTVQMQSILYNNSSFVRSISCPKIYPKTKQQLQYMTWRHRSAIFS